MKFASPEQLLGYIQSGRDLYSPSEKTYVFVYNQDGSICTYDNISEEKASILMEQDEYWGAYLGCGGGIYDTEEYINKQNDPDLLAMAESLRHLAIQWCEDMIGVADWIDVTPKKEDK